VELVVQLGLAWPGEAVGRAYYSKLEARYGVMLACLSYHYSCGFLVRAESNNETAVGVKLNTITHSLINFPASNYCKRSYMNDMQSGSYPLTEDCLSPSPLI